MKRTTTILACVAAVLSATTLAGAAYADPPWERGSKEHKRDKGRHEHKYERGYDRGERYSRQVIIVDHDRGYIREYLGRRYSGHCPPGLAKKHNGCMPPGHARRYIVGQPLTTVYEVVPDDLLVRLEPVPVGYRYVMVDRDVLLISETSKKVIDAVTLLSAVGR